MMDTILIPIYIIIFIYGIVIGSFLNVCIYRIPKKENIAIVRSHCMTCNHQLQWYDNIPLFGWLMLKGKCRYCKAPISPQYPIIEASNGALWLLVAIVNGLNVNSLLFALMGSALLTLSVIDFRTYEIPIGINIFILTLGLIITVFNYTDWLSHVIGFFVVSIFLFIIFKVTDGRGIGGGDVKLMAVAGLCIGWKLILLSFALGCIIGAPVHILRMKIAGADRVLAMGPYLSIGIMISCLWGNKLIELYLRMIGF